MSQRSALQMLLGGTNTANKLKLQKKEQRIDVVHANEVGKKVELSCPGIDTLPTCPTWDAMETLLDSMDASKSKQLLENMRARFNYPAPSVIQANAIPYLLKGLPMLATAPTGSGKTFAFIFPLLVRLRKPGKKFCRGIIVAPTREIAVQIEREIKAIAGATEWRMMRAEPKEFSKNVGRKNVDILIGTPGKINSVISESVSEFPHCECLILDECDRLLNTKEGTESFAAQIDKIITACPNKSKQVVMFSATHNVKVESLANTVLQDPVRITVGNPKAVNESITQTVHYVKNKSGKVDFIRNLREEGLLTPPCLIFVDSKDKAKGLFHDLLYDGMMIEVLSSDRTGGQRDHVVEEFRRGRLWVLICTDVLARGIDFKGVKLVINYDVPESATTYIHRVGRTGRAGDVGKAITLVGDAELAKYAKIVPVLKEGNALLPPVLLNVNKLKYLQKTFDEEAGFVNGVKKGMTKNGKKGGPKKGGPNKKDQKGGKKVGKVATKTSGDKKSKPKSIASKTKNDVMK